jgi:hypothetical protein
MEDETGGLDPGRVGVDSPQSTRDEHAGGSESDGSRTAARPSDPARQKQDVETDVDALTRDDQPADPPR